MSRFLSIKTNDPEEFTDELQITSPGTTVQAIKPGRFAVAAKFGLLKNTALMQVKLQGGVVEVEQNPGYFSVTIPFDYPFQIQDEGRLRDFGPGSAHVMNRDQPLFLRAPNIHNTLVLNVFGKHIDHTAAQLNGGEEIGKIDFKSRFSLESPEGMSLRRLASFVWNELERDGGLLETPVVADEMEKSLLAALVLAADTNGHVLLRPRRRDSSPNYMRRAEEFIREHADEPMSLVDVAQAAQISIRSLTRGFKHKYGRGPMAYLRELRLQKAQMTLSAASPRETTVTQVAMRHGFYQLSHFAAAYRKMFQEAPSETLRR